jgi:hypothetical protein
LRVTEISHQYNVKTSETQRPDMIEGGNLNHYVEEYDSAFKSE